MASSPESSSRATPHAEDGSIKETLISLIISFVMALVFRSYVVEAFIIPTGSMAPTLLGAHMRFKSAQSGYDWAVNPWYMATNEEPFAMQGNGQFGLPTVTDPMSTTRLNPVYQGGRRPGPSFGFTPNPAPTPARAGDRILVQKYLYNLFPPKRFDVVVFKNPENSSENFIKRLIALPNEQVWIAEGDVFTRPLRPRSDPEEAPEPIGEWSIARKPDRIQSSLWRTLYSSEYAPRFPERDGRAWFSSPWRGAKWQTEKRRDYRCDTAERTLLTWDSANWPIDDWVPYNEIPLKFLDMRGLQLFPVSDLRLRAGVAPDQVGLRATATIVARGHAFQAAFTPGAVALRMRPDVAPAEGSAEEPWVELASAPFAGFEPGAVTNIEFWHVDQSLEARVNGRVVARGEYNWTPSQRLLYATGTAGEDLPGEDVVGNPLALSETYRYGKPSIEWTFEGSPLTLHRVGLDRDVYYEASRFGIGQRGGPAFATHPANLVNLTSDQFFVMGDNSPASKDGRLWEVVDPWVADQIDATVGVVPRRLMLGKAFFVYFPSPTRAMGLPIPDFGRMRFIR